VDLGKMRFNIYGDLVYSYLPNHYLVTLKFSEDGPEMLFSILSYGLCIA
jgi:hypothetical protein